MFGLAFLIIFPFYGVELLIMLLVKSTSRTLFAEGEILFLKWPICKVVMDFEISMVSKPVIYQFGRLFVSLQ